MEYIEHKTSNKAKETIQKYSVQEQIELRLCNGLERIEKQEIDDIVIAGMGGEEICSILESATFLPKTLVLQPMKNADKVRKCALKLGYKFEKETLFFG